MFLDSRGRKYENGPLSSTLYPYNRLLHVNEKIAMRTPHYKSNYANKALEYPSQNLSKMLEHNEFWSPNTPLGVLYKTYIEGSAKEPYIPFAYDIPSSSLFMFDLLSSKK